MLTLLASLFLLQVVGASLVHIVITLIVIGILLWLVNQYIPMDGNVKNILNVVVLIAIVLWLLQVFGLLSGL